MHFHKKAQEAPPGDKVPFAFFILPFVIGFLIIAFLFTVKGTITFKTRASPQLEEYALANKLSSGECFAHYDPVFSMYEARSVEEERFTQEQLALCYPPGTWAAVRITLETPGGKKEIFSPNWDQQRELTRRLPPLAVLLYPTQLPATMTVELQDAK